jgi:ribA/ribD-fused uncharacterized protein
LKQIYFYSQNEEYGEFSNFAPFGIEMDGLWYPTVEHYYQSQKFDNNEYCELIRKAESPRQAAEYGKQKKFPLKENWDEIRYSVMQKAVSTKFNTHPKLQEILLNTQDAELIENSPYDFYWGCGSDGTGQNNLGKILMAVRETLRNSSINA